MQKLLQIKKHGRHYVVIMKPIFLIILVVFIGFIIVMFVKQSARQKKLYKESLYGEVISVEKGLKGYYNITILEKNKLRYISFSLANNKLMVSMYDSVYKESNSDIFYVKRSETPNFVKAEWVDSHISRKWEE